MAAQDDSRRICPTAYPPVMSNVLLRHKNQDISLMCSVCYLNSTRPILMVGTVMAAERNMKLDKTWPSRSVDIEIQKSPQYESLWSISNSWVQEK